MTKEDRVNAKLQAMADALVEMTKKKHKAYLCTACEKTVNQNLATYVCPMHIAAPEMLEALSALVSFNESDPDLYEGDDDGTLGRLMFKAQAAIAKAEGRTL